MVLDRFFSASSRALLVRAGKTGRSECAEAPGALELGTPLPFASLALGDAIGISPSMALRVAVKGVSTFSLPA